MKITILTLFPEMFKGPFEHSILKHAQEKKAVKIIIKNIRDFGIGVHKMVDDTLYGGSHGMLMRVDVLDQAVAAQKDKALSTQEQKVFLLSASGKTFGQKDAKAFLRLKHLILICGHYEGVDVRILDFIDGEISVGDFVVTGGELPAMLITDAIARLLPGVLKEGVTDAESHSQTFEEETGFFLESDHYTKPQIYKGKRVPDVLLSGNHKEIDSWRRKNATWKTKKVRSDLKKIL